jgi:Cys-tRNA(Pro)/Cys-tRNA(Cys) deacylase
MTPAVNLLKKQKVCHTVHSYGHDPGSASYGLEAAEKLAIAPEQVFKTLVITLNTGDLAVAILPVSAKLNMKQAAKALGAKKAAMAGPAEVERTTGYVLGGVSPLGQKKLLATAIDESARQYATLFVSAGRRGLELELAPEDLRALTRGVFFELI